MTGEDDKFRLRVSLLHGILERTGVTCPICIDTVMEVREILKAFSIVFSCEKCGIDVHLNPKRGDIMDTIVNAILMDDMVVPSGKLKNKEESK